MLCALQLPGVISQNQTSPASGMRDSANHLLHSMFFTVMHTASTAKLCLHPLCSAVQGLLAFKAKVRDVQGVLASWNSSSTPCSTSDCSSSSNTEDCTWAGIACQAGQVVALAMPCTVLSTGATGACALQGYPLDSLVQVSASHLDLPMLRLQRTACCNSPWCSIWMFH